MPTARDRPARDAFAARLNACLTAFGYGERGGDGRLATEYEVKPPVVSAWRSGRHLPTPAKVRRMASTWGVPFDWLYWGEGPAPARIGEASPGYSRSRAQLVGQTEAGIDELRYIVSALVSVIAAHRPAEGAAVARALRRHVPADQRTGLVSELLSVLEDGTPPYTPPRPSPRT